MREDVTSLTRSRGSLLQDLLKEERKTAATNEVIDFIIKNNRSITNSLGGVETMLEMTRKNGIQYLYYRRWQLLMS